MTMEQQMNLFEEGGMKDDGLDRDPVSGNEIPPGSLAKEVRDDIPAQLSDGEYVVPADVVQYFGVKFFEDLRAEAKRGLAEMEATGRIGGEPVEVDMTMIAFGKADDKKKKKKAEGGMIGYSNGGVADDVAEIEKARTFNPVDYATLGFTPVSPVAQTGQLQQNNITKTVTYYHGETGESRVVTFVNGIVTPPEDVQYTQPPWSTIKPSPTKVAEKEDRSDRQERSAKVIQENIEFALAQSAERLGIPLDEYKTYSTGKRFALGLEELKNIAGLEMDKAKIEEIRKTPDDEIKGFGGFVNTLVENFIEKPLEYLGLNIAGEKAENIIKENNKVLDNESNIETSAIPTYGDEFDAIDQRPKYSSDKGIQKGQEASARRYSGLAENIRYGGDIKKTELPPPMKPSIAKNVATDTKDPVDAEEENLSKAYGGGEASKKFGINKGGLISKPKRRNKK